MHGAKVVKKKLSNGLTILALPQHSIPKVSAQIWYNVGSKSERSGEKGLAHLIEHMIFKGTKKLSESDINLITHKLSGYCNAFTSNDYTGYIFDFPSQNWKESLKLMADCMHNCLFKQEFLNSELQAVIQELKMYKDDYTQSIIESMLSSIFSDHPYRYPIIGYKQDLWSMSRDALMSFYKKHYTPNNATLVVVGDASVDEIMIAAQDAFGDLVADNNLKKDNFYHSQDLKAQSVTIYRDIQQPIIMLAWVIPGSQVGKDYLIDIFTWILGSGKGSRLYKKLVDELQLVTDLEVFSYTLFEFGLFFIELQPKKLADLEKIISIIQGEINYLAKNGPTECDIARAIKKTEVEYLSILENNQKQAYIIGKYFLATEDEQYFNTYLNYPKESLKKELQDLAFTYFRPAIMHMGKVLPIESTEKHYWSLLQQISDAEDSKILAGKTRTTPVEPGREVNNIVPKAPKSFNFPIAESFMLHNGLKVLYFNNPILPKIDLIIDFKVKSYYDPEHLQGLCAFVADMMEEGTKNYSSTEFSDVLESYGMTIDSTAGQITMSMLASDFDKGMELLSEVLCFANFEPSSIEKVREQKIADLKNYWDSPPDFSGQLIREAIYKNHPYHKNLIGTEQSINYITRNDLLDFYKQFISPRNARISIVGDLSNIDLKNSLEKRLSIWHGPEVLSIDFPHLNQLSAYEINYPIARDQVVLCYGGLSVSRTNPDYDKLLIFDQIFTGGVLGSMSSRLFDLREATGLFYTISGSLIARVGLEPGMIVIKTIVSNDRLKEAESEIEDMIDNAIETLTHEEFEEAKQAVINSLVDNFSSNHHTALSMLFKDTYGLADDFFSKRAGQLLAVDFNDTKEAVRRWLNSEKLVKIRIGRID